MRGFGISSGAQLRSDSQPATTHTMSDQPNDTTQIPGAEKDPEGWVTGDESMTAPQGSYLKTLSHAAGVEFEEAHTKAEASKRIDGLQQQTGRGVDH